jgi:NAD+ kinase
MDNVLLVFKKSLYQIYFVEGRLPEAERARYRDKDVARLKASDDEHRKTLDHVCKMLEDRKIRFRPIYRARLANYEPHDFIIAVGGDGTFIEAARRATSQTMLGVNSDPDRSQGFFCRATTDNIGEFLDRAREGAVETTPLTRMAIELDGVEQDYQAINDILVAHRFSAAMSRYHLRIDGREEMQRGSGLWVSTAAGSTGAISSAGGQQQPLDSRQFQYLMREPMAALADRYDMQAGFVDAKTGLTVTSGMRQGTVFVDGPHMRVPLPFGAQVTLRESTWPLKIVTGFA